MTATKTRPVTTLAVDLGDPRPAASEPATDYLGEVYAVECSLRSLLHLGAVTAPRGRQEAIGMSEIGNPCDRRLAHRLAGTRPVNVTDPSRALVGTGWHAAVAEVFRRLDAGSGRFEVERRVNYRGVPGTLDLFDRAIVTAIDWKTTTKSKLGRIRYNGPDAAYVTQLQMYGAALAASGETVRWVALAYVPVDGTLDDLWLWRTPFDATVADAAVARANGLRDLDHPNAARATPGRLCPWCPYYRPNQPATRESCPGATMEG